MISSLANRRCSNQACGRQRPSERRERAGALDQQMAIDRLSPLRSALVDGMIVDEANGNERRTRPPADARVRRAGVRLLRLRAQSPRRSRRFPCCGRER